MKICTFLGIANQGHMLHQQYMLIEYTCTYLAGINRSIYLHLYAEPQEISCWRQSYKSYIIIHIKWKHNEAWMQLCLYLYLIHTCTLIANRPQLIPSDPLSIAFIHVKADDNILSTEIYMHVVNQIHFLWKIFGSSIYYTDLFTRWILFWIWLSWWSQVKSNLSALTWVYM